ncbi:hypothetical protein NKI95_06510 [Mesorhizobium sp. M0306]|uniref:hypothetical protein n=1 Tax=Mesorhizobium sp. M0306 TaxID=2956932 RepID=UPI00333C62F5
MVRLLVRLDLSRSRQSDAVPWLEFDAQKSATYFVGFSHAVVHASSDSDTASAYSALENPPAFGNMAAKLRA